ncbi:hypothetical protein GUJ93_ZPchr0004g39769 [Zizania palustris]|uniref:Phosphatidic acid phosphatase type 2/haloperoxidase domain-containing protein n=1 Tax=Zizania palustris TaxID=103762 RepID=A0A8J5VNM5_ZIZPA|nr:hypothetical protein GUJ93_ZPchr0004g39769 [Zizania palustris]
MWSKPSVSGDAVASIALLDLPRGVLFSVLITAVVTTVLKNAVGRPRPDLFWQCFPDGKQVEFPDMFLYDQVTGGVICHGEENFLKDGCKSFASGHTSWSFTRLGFLSVYLSGKIKVFDCQGRCVCWCPSRIYHGDALLFALLSSSITSSRLGTRTHTYTWLRNCK